MDTTISNLKLVCKILHIKNYSGATKKILEQNISKHLAVLKIQRWFRKSLSRGEHCPISLEPIRYPCFAFKTEKIFIYYNLKSIKDFLIESGNFKDPISRITYTDDQLTEMDNIDKHYKTITKNKDKFKSVFKASKNTKFYDKKKNKEYELLLFERIIDEICNDIIELINNETNKITIKTVLALYIYDYSNYIKRLLFRSKEHTKYVLDKSIDLFNKILLKEVSKVDKTPLYDHVLHSIYYIRENVALS